MRREILAVILAAGAALISANLVRAQNLFEKLVMPGDVIEGHTKLQKDCGKCHEPFSKKEQKRLCLDCHKDIAKDIADKSGFHGKRSDIAGVECKHCHTDHKGRKADIVLFDPQTFNHTFADFELKGHHTSAPCEGCHAPDKKFREAPSTCFACHKKVEPHKGALGEDCAKCHTEDGWRKQKPFDHAKTKFALEGAHKEVRCAVCHVGERYKDLPRACVDCHRIQEPHQGRYGAKCETCHGPVKWKTIRFDHTKDTKFPLIGEHTKVKCDTCHTGDLYKDKLATTCVSCHKEDDPHKGQQGARCEQCHAPTGWRQKVSFDHDLTRFPLIGLHARVPCEECHRGATFKDAPTDCRSCHKDEHHKGRLGTDCKLCHNPNGFALWRFDHDKQTKFALTGAHAGLECHACHTAEAATKVSAPTQCFECHRRDDVHRGSFGRNCDKCHSTQSFRRGAASP